MKNRKKNPPLKGAQAEADARIIAALIKHAKTPEEKAAAQRTFDKMMKGKKDWEVMIVKERAMEIVKSGSMGNNPKQRVLEVIPSKRWKNKKSGATASLYGSVPWTSDASKKDWVLETVGWTWRNSNGTIGLGRVPAKTKEEAEEVMRRINDNPGKKGIGRNPPRPSDVSRLRNLKIGQHVTIDGVNVKRVTRDSYHAAPPGGGSKHPGPSGTRWGTAVQISEDLEHFRETGALPRSKVNWNPKKRRHNVKKRKSHKKKRKHSKRRLGKKHLSVCRDFVKRKRKGKGKRKHGKKRHSKRKHGKRKR